MISRLNRLVWFLALALVQVLVLNNVWLFNVATPLLYVYFVITFHRNTPKGEILLWSFCLGLLIDIFANTPGLAAGTLTLIALLQPYLLELFVPRDSVEDLDVSVATLGLGKFCMMSAVLIFLYALLFFALESFNFFSWQLWLARTLFSTVLTMIVILAVESIRSK